MPVDADGRIRTTFAHTPSTLRLSSVEPNLQNIPRGGGVESYVKEIFKTPEGFVFWERDYSGIEAVLVGYFAGSAKYIRLAKLGVHDYLASHIIGRPAEVSWDDIKLGSYLRDIKKNFKAEREVAKRCIHGGNYMMTARRTAELYPDYFPTVKKAAELQELYFGVFPEIRKWHRNLCERVDGTKRRKADPNEAIPDPWTLGVCFAQNPFGYTHRFYDVLHWQKINGEWYSEYGEDAKRLVAFLPQSTAAAIIKKSAKKLFNEYPWVGDTLRLLIHDSMLGECRDDELEMCLKVSADVMERPIEELPLDPAWGMGDYLTIGSEAKFGKSWGSMK